MSATVSKAEFAAICGVKPSRVSHWIRDGKIKLDALTGAHRSARVHVEKAQAQLRRNLDQGQLMSNGAKTSAALTRPAEPAPVTEPSDADVLWGVLTETPCIAAWEVALDGGTLQQAYNVYAALKLNIGTFTRDRGAPESPFEFEEAGWDLLADEAGLPPVEEAVLEAEWQRLRDED